MVLRQKIVKVACEWADFGGTVAGSQWINQLGRGWFCGCMRVRPVCLSKDGLNFLLP